MANIVETRGQAGRVGSVSLSGWNVVRVVLGCLLLAAAALKASALWSGPVTSVSLVSSPRWQVALIEVETVLGLWLLSGWSARGVWLAAVGFFGVLAGASLYLALDGQSSCGCWGSGVKVSPWWALAVDAVALASLVWYRPLHSDGRREGVSALRQGFRVTAGSVAILAGLFSALTWLYGSPSAALLHLRGEAVTVDPPLTDVGEGRLLEVRSFTVQLTNHTDRPIRILGGDGRLFLCCDSGFAAHRVSARIARC